MDKNIMEFIELIKQNDSFDEILELEKEEQELVERFEKNIVEFNDLRTNGLT